MQHILTNALSAFAQRANIHLRRSAIFAVIALTGLFLFLGAAIFAIAAGYLWLVDKVPPPQAALIVACILVLCGLVAIAVAAYKSRSTRTVPPLREEPGGGETEQLVEKAVRDLVAETRDNAGGSMLTALALGMVVGLLRPNDKQQP